MELDNIYKYLGLTIVAIIALYIILKSLTFQARVIEGLTSSSNEATDKDKVPAAIKSHTTALLDGLLIDKYRSSYDDTIIDLEENINATLLSSILKNAELISSDPSSDASQKSIVTLNNLKAFKDTLNESMKYLDGMKSSGSGSGSEQGGKWF